MAECFWQDLIHCVEDCEEAPSGPSYPTSGPYIERKHLVGAGDGVDSFGYYGVMINSDTAFISTQVLTDDGGGGYNYGPVAVDVYSYTAEDWVYGGTLSESEDMRLIDAVDDWAVFTVAVPGGGYSSAGLYVYGRSGSTWTKNTLLTVANPNSTIMYVYGGALSPDGKYLFAAVADYYGPSAPYAAVHIYKRTGTTWTFSQKIDVPHSNMYPDFGEAVSVGATVAAISEPKYDTPVSNAGIVYTYELSGETWSAGDTIQAPAPGNNHQFGVGVSVAGEDIVVGVRDRATAVQRFKKSGGSWSQTYSDAETWYGKPWVHGSDDGLTMLSQESERTGTAETVGHIFVREYAGGSWTVEQEIIPAHPDNGSPGAEVEVVGIDAFGPWIIVSSVQVNPDYIPYDGGVGHVFIYSR